MRVTVTDREHMGLARLRLLRLCSPTLPIGSFSWSQGLETAVERSWIYDLASAYDWVAGTMLASLAKTEGPYLARLYWALQADDQKAFHAWNQELKATRETRELLQEDLEQGELLHRVNTLHYADVSPLLSDYTLAAAFAEALWKAELALQEGLEAFFWMWAEGQVVQLIKLLPLGLRDGQALLDQVLRRIPEAVACAWNCPEDELGLSVPGRSMASAWHETQYCRIYRS